MPSYSYRVRSIIIPAGKALGRGLNFGRSVFFVLVLLIGLVGCGENFSDTDDGVLRLGNGGEPRDLDPHIVTGTPEVRILQALFEGLIAYPREHPGDPEPGVAERWEMSEDGMVWTFYLRKNARWSNGEQMTAHDFVYSWRRSIEPGLVAEYADWKFIIKGAEDYFTEVHKDFGRVGLRAIDKHTFEVTLVAPTADFLLIILHHSFLPVHPETIEKHGGIDVRFSGWTQPEHLVGNGPFQLKNWSPNTYLEVERNPFYWDAKTVGLNGMRFYPVSDENTEERAFRTGQLHITSAVPAGLRDRYLQERPGEIRMDPLSGIYFYRIQSERPYLDDVRVRRALSLTIDRERLVKNVTRGGERAAYSLVPDPTGDYRPPQGFIEYNPERARELLAEAGYEGGKGLNGLELLYNTSDNHRRLAEAVQQMWRNELGISVKLVNQEWQVFLDSTQNMNYYISRGGWVGNLFPLTFLRIYQSDNPNNQTGFRSERFDDLIVSARHTLDDESRFAQLREAEGILLESAVVIPVYWYTNPYLIQPEVRNWISHPVDLRPYKYVKLIE